MQVAYAGYFADLVIEPDGIVEDHRAHDRRAAIRRRDLNQQVVRADGSAPWDEGTGGGGSPPARDRRGDPLDASPSPKLPAEAERRPERDAPSPKPPEIREALRPIDHGLRDSRRARRGATDSRSPRRTEASLQACLDAAAVEDRRVDRRRLNRSTPTIRC